MLFLAVGAIVVFIFFNVQIVQFLRTFAGGFGSHVMPSGGKRRKSEGDIPLQARARPLSQKFWDKRGSLGPTPQGGEKRMWCTYV